MGIYTLSKICPLAAGKVRNVLPVDRPVDLPTVIFMNVEPPVDRPVDWDWIQRAAALCRSTDRRPGPFSESRALWTIDRPVDRPTSPWLRADFGFGRPSVDRQTARSNYYRD